MSYQSSLYRYLSLIKLILWIIVLVIDYTAINVFEDPVVAISVWLVWCFLICRWTSFFFFLFFQRLFQRQDSQILIEQISYKLSFLFWMYALLNVILILLWHWDKFRWLVLLCFFFLFLYMLFLDNSKHAKKSE